ncbi:TetR/AcrR family transcriptional regulator [Nocardia jiangxiensis]|uniref:TetR/AcrR family transcriptional regulator n=1 Tax=Nocardia jiangxiensis TaxID=282685 RepID=A0ABW6RWX2_9NOCA|nr:TetR-like C-terminal domain-containing protein [Nocardia jiangxiensis]
MPRAGLSRAEVVRAGAELADEIGFANLSMGLLAEKLSVRTPSLYKHVASLAELQHDIAALAMSQADILIRDAMHGLSGTEALRAFAHAFGDYVAAHPGRYNAINAAGFTGPDDPLLESSGRVIDSIAAVLRGYGIPDADMDHAVRTLRCAFHGFAALQASGGFHWTGEPQDSYEWMISFIDRGLRSTDG